LGYEGDFELPPASSRFGPTPGSFGHLGAGGPVGFADPQHGVAVGFLRSHLHDWSASTDLIDALYACLASARNSASGQEFVLPDR